MIGTIIKSTGSRYILVDMQGSLHHAKARGNLRLQDFEATNPIAVGDKVEFEHGDLETVMITKLLDRKNYMIRKSVKLSKQVQILAANIDFVFAVATPAQPRTSLGFIDRVLATAEAYNIKAGIIWNKADQYADGIRLEVDRHISLYEKIGYKNFMVSSLTGQGIDQLLMALKNQISLLCGHSGVGKSSLVNRLIPGLTLKTSSISKQHDKGVHTTTFAEMHPLLSGGYIVDSPGIREFGTFDFDQYEVSHFFPEIFQLSKACKFNNCLHTNEQLCAVKNAVASGELALSRFDSYNSILEGRDIYK
ncbi:MAG: ribosome small subunit-dependent GTPase [Bacteroidota bacterium]|jgi:ribosome biogenesis GTPase / thiamine phosphate phosphatase